MERDSKTPDFFESFFMNGAYKAVLRCSGITITNQVSREYPFRYRPNVQRPFALARDYHSQQIETRAMKILGVSHTTHVLTQFRFPI